MGVMQVEVNLLILHNLTYLQQMLIIRDSERVSLNQPLKCLFSNILKVHTQEKILWKYTELCPITSRIQDFIMMIFCSSSLILKFFKIKIKHKLNFFSLYTSNDHLQIHCYLKL